MAECLTIDGDKSIISVDVQNTIYTFAFYENKTMNTSYDLTLVGMRFQKQNISIYDGEPLTMFRDTENRFSKKAIGIKNNDGVLVGYLPEKEAALFGDLWLSRGIQKCVAQERYIPGCRSKAIKIAVFMTHKRKRVPHPVENPPPVYPNYSCAPNFIRADRANVKNKK